MHFSWEASSDKFNQVVKPIRQIRPIVGAPKVNWAVKMHTDSNTILGGS